MEDKIRVLRVLEYVGERKEIERTLLHSAVPINGQKGDKNLIIRSSVVGYIPETITEEEFDKLKNEVSLKAERKTLNQLIEEVFKRELSDRDYECVEKDVSYQLLCGFTLQECVEAAKKYYDEHPIYDDDIPACFGYGLNANLRN